MSTNPQHQEQSMHYKNGREAKNGDKVVLVSQYTDSNGKVVRSAPVVGILFDATPGNDYCNGKLASMANPIAHPNLKECVHLDDFMAALPTAIPPDTSNPAPAPAAAEPAAS